ncbi:unnamed protein product [Anisakis simplex]|uniref:Inositol oxygenase n=1 Tax=Anisakis simplex TaxID=6269 RepID=A0A0M3K7J7_ANISI|nr:unnamed protein product [Anisakis simplex]
MADILALSKVPANLLIESEQKTRKHEDFDDESRFTNVSVQKKDLEAPKRSGEQCGDHELLSEHSRMVKTVANAVDERRALCGNAHAEHMIRELYTAAQINRGPPGVSSGSRLHWDVLLGRDETLDAADYLNFEADAKF